MNLAVMHRDDRALGGFAGLKEHRLVMDPKAFGGREEPGTWPGIGNFVYLADARFLPHGDTRLHGHREVDVISVMVEGRIVHEGSLGHGQSLDDHSVQAQRAGSEGFEHNEVNPDSRENRMIQLWVLPERSGEPARYHTYHMQWGEIRRVYGGPEGNGDTLDSHTLIEIAWLNATQCYRQERPFIAYLTRGCGEANGQYVRDGDLLRGDSLEFQSLDQVQLIVVHHNPEA